jgi:hypothetical protein
VVLQVAQAPPSTTVVVFIVVFARHNEATVASVVVAVSLTPDPPVSPLDVVPTDDQQQLLDNDPDQYDAQFLQHIDKTVSGNNKSHGKIMAKSAQ